jgi:hypothetical protein
VTFRMDDDCVLVEMIVPYVAPEPKPLSDPNRIPMAIRESCHQEIDEQLTVGEYRPFAGSIHEG